MTGLIRGGRNMLQASGVTGIYGLMSESSVLTLNARSVGVAYYHADAIVTEDDAAVAVVYGVDSVAWVRSHFSVGIAAGPYEKVVITSSMSIAISIDHTSEIEVNHDDCMVISAGPVHVRGRNCIVVFQPFTPDYVKITCDKPTMIVLRKVRSQQAIALVWSGFNESLGKIYQDYLEWKRGKECCGPFLDIDKEFDE